MLDVLNLTSSISGETALLAVFIYHEPFVKAQAYTFGMVWTALAAFSIDAIIHYRQIQHQRASL